MVYSATSIPEAGGTTHFLLAQAVGAFVGIILMVALLRVPVGRLRVHAPTLVVAAFTLLAVVLVIGASVNGARRAFSIGGIAIAPVPLALLAFAFWAAAYLSSRRVPRDLPELARPFGLLTGTFALLFLLEPDLGAALVLLIVATVAVYVAGVPGRTLTAGGTLIVVLGLVAAWVSPYRRMRLLTFLHPSSDPMGAGYQSIQALIGLGSGRWFGRGLGQGLIKDLYLPNAHTSMIFATVGEELGLFGTAFTLAAFGVFCFAGLRIAFECRDMYGRLLATAVTAVIAAEACLNLLGVLGLFPQTSTLLPFISYGPFSLAITLGSVGLLLAVNGRTALERAAVVEEFSAGRRSFAGPAAADVHGEERATRGGTASHGHGGDEDLVEITPSPEMWAVNLVDDAGSWPDASALVLPEGPEPRLRRHGLFDLDVRNDRLRMPRGVARTRLERCLVDGDRISSSVPARLDRRTAEAWTNDADRWLSVTRHALFATYSNHEPVQEFSLAAVTALTLFAETEAEKIELRAAGIRRALNVLRGLTERLEYAEEVVGMIDASTIPPSGVFLVHGHSDVRHEVARFLDRIVTGGVTILEEKPRRGRTIIEQFEEHAANARFAVVLLTGDDEGRERGTDEMKPRARQNVILELGFFIGRLGRQRVALLYEEGVELPSDMSGVLHLPLDRPGAWKARLATELHASGLAIQLDKLVDS